MSLSKVRKFESQFNLRHINLILHSLENPSEKYGSKAGLEPWLLLILLTVIWGTSFILIKNGLKAFSPGEAASLRIIFAFAVLTPVVIRDFGKFRPGEFRYIVFSGVVGNLVTSYLFSLAQTRIDSSVSGMLNGLTPVFAVIIASLFFGYRFRFIQIAGVAISLAGAIVLSVASEGADGSRLNYYALLIVVATVCYALNLNIIKAKLSNVSSPVIVAFAMFTIVPFCIVYLFAFSDFIGKMSAHPQAVSSLLSLAALGAFSTALALVLYNRLIKQSNPLFASSVAYLIPVVAVLWGLADGEKLNWLHYSGMGLILAGVILANKISNQ